MTQSDDVQAPENEPSPVPAGEPGDSAVDAGVPSRASAPRPQARRSLDLTWKWLTTGVWAALAWLGLALACWVAMSQIGSIVAEVTPTGQYPVSALTGIGQLGSLATAPHATLVAWDEAGTHFHSLAHWLWWYLGTDLLFIAGLAMLGVTILKNRTGARLARWLLGTVAAAYAVEAATGAVTLALARSTADGAGTPDAMAWPLHIATELKWVAVLVLLAWVAYRVHASYRGYRASGLAKDDRRGGYADIRRLSQALEVQRFSLVVVLLLTLIAIGPPLNGTLEQMPDVQRAWLNGGSQAGWPQLLLAAGTQLLLASMLASLGRMRTMRARAKFGGHGDDIRADPQYPVWFGIAAVLGAAALVLSLTGGARVSWSRVLTCCGILVLIALLSIGVDLLARRRGAAFTAFPGRDLPERDRNVVRTARLTGDALAVAALGVTPLGAVRSFTAPALIIGGPAVVAVVAGVIGSVAVPLHCGLLPFFRQRDGADAALPVLPPALAAGTAASTPRTPRAAVAQRRQRNRHLAGPTRIMWGIGAVFLIAGLWLVIAPLSATHVLGVLATVVIAIGSLASLLGTLAFLVQTRQPLPLFRALRLNVTPVLTIIMIIALADGIVDKNLALHQVSGPVAAGTYARPSLADALGTWLHSPLTTSCARPAGTQTAGGHPVRIEPLIQVAASGGGIRAAWWTLKVLGTIAGGPCGQHDVFAVSSVSGGSVGTAVLASVPAGTAAPVSAAAAGITTMADPDALAAAIDGLMLRDTIAGYTGLDLRAAQMPSAQRFPDRAALMQTVWQHQDPMLGAPFPLRHSWLPWALLFNSTSVSTGCRAILSSVALPGPAATMAQPAGLSCGLGSAGLAGSYDFFARLRCLRNLSTSAAALLSARYAYITPSGTLDGCGSARGTFADQLVDGGYGDSTGLSTLLDLAPSVMARVRQYNDRAMASAAAGQPVTLIVPVTVYLGNSVQPARTLVVPARTPEIDVPTTALSAGPATELTGTDALLQNMAAATGQAQWMNCGSADATCADARAIARDAVPDPLVMVTPTEYPDVAAPLGWLLSQASQKALDGALQRDIKDNKPCGAYQPAYLTQRPYCLPGVGGLADLLALTRLDSAHARRR